MPPGEPPGGRAGATTELNDPGLARERTALAWTRSGLSVAVIGGLIARACLSAHLDVLGILIAIFMTILALVIWRRGQVSYVEVGPPAVGRRSRFLAGLATATLFTALLAIIVTLAV